MKANKFKDYFLSVFFTKKCKYCLSVCDIRKDICDDCENNLNKITGEICNKCGCEKRNCECGNKGAFQFYESVCAPYYYDGAPKEAIKNLKFGKKTYMAKSLADDMTECFKERYHDLDFDFCTFVPAFKKDEKKRGFNQSELLAGELCKNLNIPLVRLLNKDFKTAQQHNLPEALRSGNLVGAISFNEKEDIKDCRILLCDDIKTSGETLNECAKTLLINGAAEVRCITYCITKKQKNSRR